MTATKTENTIDILEKEILASYKVFNENVAANLGRFITPDGIDMVNFQQGYRREAEAFASQMVRFFLQGGEISAQNLSSQVAETIHFDPLTPEVLATVTQLKQRVIEGLMVQQQQALQEMRRAAEAITPIRQAAQVRETITLSQRQVQAVNNYRAALEQQSSTALNRQLRDRRFDSTVRRAIKEKKPLTETQIDRMVSRYAERQLSSRARTIAQTEAVRIANASDETFYRQALSRNDITPQQVKRTWVSSKDSVVRDTHRSLDGQVQEFMQPWVSPSGAVLRFPGDPSAPPEEVINCRCWVLTEVKEQAA